MKIVFLQNSGTGQGIAKLTRIEYLVKLCKKTDSRIELNQIKNWLSRIDNKGQVEISHMAIARLCSYNLKLAKNKLFFKYKASKNSNSR